MHKLPYDTQTRAAAIDMLTSAGYPSRRGALIAASRALGIPTATLRRWAAASPGDLLLVDPGAGAQTAPLDILPGAIRAEMAATLRSIGAARPDATYKELIAGFVALADRLRQLGPPDGPPEETGPGQARERLAQMVGLGQADAQAEE